MKKKIFNLVLSSLSSLIILLILIADFVKAKQNGYFESDGYGKSIYLNEEYLFMFYASLALNLCVLYNTLVFKKKGEENKTSVAIGTSLSSLIIFAYYSKSFFKALNKGKGFNDLYFIIMSVSLLLAIYFICNLIALLKLNKKDNK